MREPLLQSQPIDDGDRGVRVVVQCGATVGNLVERPEATVDRGVQHVGHETRLVSPPHRAVGENVEERRAGKGDCRGDLAAQVVPVARRGLCDVRHVVCRRQWQSCPCAAAPSRSSRSRQGSSWSTLQTGLLPSAGCRCSCTPRCRNKRRESRGRAPSLLKAPANRCRRFRRRRRIRPLRPRWTEARSAAREHAAHFRRRSQRLRRFRRRREATGRSRLCSGSAWSRLRGNRSRSRQRRAGRSSTTPSGRPAGSRTPGRVSVRRGAEAHLSRCGPSSSNETFVTPHADVARLVPGENRTDVVWMQVATSQPVDMPAQCRSRFRRARRRSRREAPESHPASRTDRARSRARCLQALPRHQQLGTDGTSRSAASRHALPPRAAHRPSP